MNENENHEFKSKKKQMTHSPKTVDILLFKVEW